MNKKFLRDYMNTHSPVAEEWEAQKVWSDYIRPFVDELKSDHYGTVYGIVKSKALDKQEDSANPKNRYKVVIEAHADEIAYIITHLDKDGIVYVARHGGSDAAIAPSKKVLIHTRKNGKIPGIFGFPAIHVRVASEEKSVKPENLWIDIGVSSDQEARKLGVEVGNLITFDEEFSELGDFYCGKSLDNKIGGFIIAEVTKRLKENNVQLPYDLYIVNSVQEEVGLLGAKNIAQALKADVAFVHDVCHATDSPKMSKIKNADIKAGSGPTLEYASQNHRLVLDFIRDVADNNKIDYQLEPGSQGNDTMAFFLANTPTAIIATPLRYMHTTCEMVHKKDVKKAINLFYQCLVNLDCRSWNYYDF